MVWLACVCLWYGLSMLVGDLCWLFSVWPWYSYVFDCWIWDSGILVLVLFSGVFVDVFVFGNGFVLYSWWFGRVGSEIRVSKKNPPFFTDSGLVLYYKCSGQMWYVGTSRIRVFEVLAKSGNLRVHKCKNWTKIPLKASYDLLDMFWT